MMPARMARHAAILVMSLTLAFAGCARGGGSAAPSPVAPTGTKPAETNYVDTHVHIVPSLPGFARNYQSAVRAETDSTGLDAATSELVNLMDQYGVNKTILVSVPGKSGQEQADEAGIRRAARKYPTRLFWVGGGAVLAEDLQSIPPGDVTEAQKSQFESDAQAVLDEGAKGFGEMISAHLCLSSGHSYQFSSPDHPLFLALADVAARNDVPIDIHLEAIPEATQTPPNILAACDKNPEVLPASMPAFKRLLSHNPEAKIVWQHAGWDNTGYRTPELTRELLASHPNLYVALRVEKRTTQVGTESKPMPNRIVTANGDIDPAWLEVFNSFPDRFVVGADGFITPRGKVEGPSMSYSETWLAVGNLPDELRSKIGRDNATRLYKLG